MSPAVLPPIEYDKPYANISIWEARTCIKSKNGATCKELFTMLLAPDACTPASASSSSSRTKTSFDFVTHPNMSCAMSMDIATDGTATKEPECLHQLTTPDGEAYTKLATCTKEPSSKEVP